MKVLVAMQGGLNPRPGVEGHNGLTHAPVGARVQMIHRHVRHPVDDSIVPLDERISVVTHFPSLNTPFLATSREAGFV